MEKIKKFSLLLLTVLSVTCLGGCHKDPDEPDPVEPVVDPLNDLSFRDAKGENGLVSAATPYASKAGLDILQKGGNAFDAVAAVGFALGVTEPNATGLGGSGTFVAYIANTGEVKQYNFNAMIGAKQTPDLYDDEIYLDQMKRGPLSVAVPGTVMGLTTLVNDFGSGKVTLSDTIDPAIKLCEEGFELAPFLASNIYFEYFLGENMEQTLSIYGNYDEKKQKYTRAKRAGEIIKNPNQANVLREIQKNGAEGFYKGWVAEECIKAIQDANTLTLEDFEYFLNHGGYYSTPLHTTYTASSDGQTYDVYTANTPNSGGVILVEMLNEIETYGKAKGLNYQTMGIDNPEYIHLIGSAMQYAYSDRRHYVADNGINPVTNKPFNVLPINGLTNKEYAYNRFTKVFKENEVCKLNSEQDYGEKIGVNPWDYESVYKQTNVIIDAPNQDGVGTTSFSVIDKDGNMCCMTFTNSSYWGSYIMPDKCGFMLNNSVTNFNRPEGINQFLPYKHAAGYLSPSLALIEGSPFAAFGAPGSEKIPVVEAQVFLNMVEHKLDCNAAVQKGRIFSYRVTPNDGAEMEDPETENYKNKKLISVETYDYSEATLNALREKGYSIHAYTEPGIAAVQALKVNYDANGKKINYEGAGDARRGGKALAY